MQYEGSQHRSLNLFSELNAYCSRIYSVDFVCYFILEFVNGRLSAAIRIPAHLKSSKSISCARHNHRSKETPKTIMCVVYLKFDYQRRSRTNAANGRAYCIQYTCVGILSDTENRKFVYTNCYKHNVRSFKSE